MAKNNRTSSAKPPVVAQTPAEEPVVETTVETEEVSDAQPTEAETVESPATPSDASGESDAPVEETPAPIAVIEDELTKKVPVAAPVVEEAPVVETPVEEPVIEAAVEPAPTVAPVDPEDKLVSDLNELLTKFKDANGGFGKTPEDFRLSATRAAAVVKFVIRYPKVNVLNALLAFFVENKDGAAAGDRYMLGSTTLTKTEEQQLGYLFGLFGDLAARRIVPINAAQVVQILGKPEITGFYNRKVSGFRAAK